MTTTIQIEQNDGFAQQVAAGAQTIFDYDFPLYDEEHIEVLRTNALTGVITTLAITTDYTVQDVGVEAGGTITLTAGATVNDVYTMRLNVPEARTTDFQVAGDFNAETLNQELDLQTQMIQQLRRDLSRALLPPADESSIDALPSAAERASKFLAFDVDGNPIASAGSVDSLAVSVFIQTLIDDANAAAARATLGLIIGTDVQAYSAILAVVTSGNYTPTAANIANLDSTPTMYPTQYMRVGNAVTVSGRFTLDPTTTLTSTHFTMTLPIASNFASDYECCGTAVCPDSSGDVAAIIGDVTNNIAEVICTPTATGNRLFYFHYTYKII